jgi:hypothetical protein
VACIDISIIFLNNNPLKIQSTMTERYINLYHQQDPIPGPIWRAELRNAPQILLLLHCYVISYLLKFMSICFTFVLRNEFRCVCSVLESVFISVDLFMVKINITKQFVQSCSSVFHHMLVLCWESVEHQNTSDSLTNRKLVKP